MRGYQIHNPATDRRHPVGFGGRQERDKFFSAVADGTIGMPESLPEYSDHAACHQISGNVPVDVIDSFEAVDIEEKQAQQLVFLGGLLQLAGKRPVQISLIVKTGKRLPVDLLPEHPVPGFDKVEGLHELWDRLDRTIHQNLAVLL